MWWSLRSRGAVVLSLRTYFCSKIEAMKQVILNVEEGKYALLLQILQDLDYVKIVQNPTVLAKNSQKALYDFSDLVGRLQWQGDAVVQQRRMRDEW